MKHTNKILGAIIVLLALTTAYFYDKPAEVITEECEECVQEVCEPERLTVEVPVEKIVIKQVVKEVPVEKVVITEKLVFVDKIVEKIVYKECEEKKVKIESISIYPQSNSVKFYISTDLETKSTVKVYPANLYLSYDSEPTTEHTIQTSGLTPQKKYHYELTFITEDGAVARKEGEFWTTQ